MTVAGAQRFLTWSALAFTAGLLAHNLDHAVRQSRGLAGLTPGVFGAGAAVYGMTFGAIGLVLARRPIAPLAAVIVGFGTAVLVATVHLFLPESSPFSDPYPLLPVDQISWIAMLSEVVTALVFGVAGVVALHTAAMQRPYARY